MCMPALDVEVMIALRNTHRNHEGHSYACRCRDNGLIGILRKEKDHDEFSTLKTCSTGNAQSDLNGVAEICCRVLGRLCKNPWPESCTHRMLFQSASVFTLRKKGWSASKSR